MPALPHFGLHEISPSDPDLAPFSHPVLTLTIRMGDDESGSCLGQREAAEDIR